LERTTLLTSLSFYAGFPEPPNHFNETISSDLEESRDCLAAVEGAMDMKAKEGETLGPNESDRAKPSLLDAIQAGM
jgi:hypothetical protein